MDQSDDARENSIRSGFLSADTEAYTHRKRVSQRLSTPSHCMNGEYTQNDVEISVLPSIHVNTADYVLSERKQ